MTETIIKPLISISTIFKLNKEISIDNSFFEKDNLLFKNEILTPCIKLGLFFNCLLNSVINIKIKKQDLKKYFFFNLSYEGYIFLGNDSNKFKRLNIKEINVYYKKDIFLEIITEYCYLTINDIEKYINRINDFICISKEFNSFVNYKLYLNYSKFPLVIINNLFNIKNIEKAIHYESIRHEDAIRKNIILNPEIRTFKKNITVFVSDIKEDQDFNGNLKIINYTIDSLINTIKKVIQKSKEEKIEYLMVKYNLSNEIIKLLVSYDILFESFNDLVEYYPSKLVIKWINIYISELKYRSFNYNKFDKSTLQKLLNLVFNNKISHVEAVNILRNYLDDDNKFYFDYYYKKNDFNDENISLDIEKEVLLSIDKFSKQIKEYKNGNTKVLNYIIGYLLKKLNGKINAKDIQKLLIKNIK